MEKKLDKIDNIYLSWKTAYELAPDESGVIYIHLNKTKDFDAPLILFDKMGLQHAIDLNEVEFLIQKKAIPLPIYLNELVAKQDYSRAKIFLQNMLERILDGFNRGIADNDYALLQNTGYLMTMLFTSMLDRSSIIPR